MENKLKKIWSEMPTEQADLQIGKNTNNLISEAFSKQRPGHAGVGARPYKADEAQKQWGKIMEIKEVSPCKRTVYIHIPFCIAKCTYCVFFQNFSEKKLENEYVDALIKELEMAGKAPYIQARPIHAVFFGGGTPSALSAKNIARVLQCLKENIPLVNDYELTIEARIHDLVPEKIEAWIKGGVNRVSIGVQSFFTKIRKSLGRLDSQEVVLERLKLLSSYEQCVVIIDLIYGLPYQNMENWKRDLEIADSACIDGFDLYKLNLFDSSVLKTQIDKGLVPQVADTSKQAEMFAFAYQWLTDRGYRRLSSCHWAKTNRERSLYNSYTKAGVEMFPFGAGGGGNIAGSRCMLHRDINAYMKSIEMGKKPLMMMMPKVVGNEVMNTIVNEIEQGYLNLGKLTEKYGQELQQLEWLLDLWTKRGLMTKGKVFYKLTVAGQFWDVNISQSLLEAVQTIRTGNYGTMDLKLPKDMLKRKTMKKNV